MQEFQGKVAVITGGASGIGLGLARRCATEGMRIVLADIEAAALTRAADELRAGGAQVLAVPTDVAQAAAVDELARQTMDHFGAVHLLCNNAGVGGGGTVWESSLADWQWVLGVNLWGVIHGLRAFVPLMLNGDSAGHIVNTASIAGLTVTPGIGTYTVSKHAVVALSETLYQELAQRKAKIKVSVLCPGFVNTRIMDSERNRPAALRSDQPASPRLATMQDRMRQEVEAGQSTERVAATVFAAIRAEQFYILTHPEMKASVQARMDSILTDSDPPRFVPPPQHA